MSVCLTPLWADADAASIVSWETALRYELTCAVRRHERHGVLLPPRFFVKLRRAHDLATARLWGGADADALARVHGQSEMYIDERLTELAARPLGDDAPLSTLQCLSWLCAEREMAAGA